MRSAGDRPAEIGLAQGRLEHFAVGVARQRLGPDGDVLRHLGVGEVLPREVVELAKQAVQHAEEGNYMSPFAWPELGHYPGLVASSGLGVVHVAVIVAVNAGCSEEAFPRLARTDAVPGQPGEAPREQP